MKQKNKFILLLSLGFVLLFSSTSSIMTAQYSSHFSTSEEPIVFAEYITATWCPQCPIASETLNDLHQEYDSFYYVTLVVDENEASQKRSRQFTNYAVPSVYFDGGYGQHIGNSGSLYDIYTNKIEESVQRTDRKSIVINGGVEIKDENNVQLSITVTNMEQKTYIGKIRTYITEKESRWYDTDQKPYHFSLIDFAINEKIILKKGETQTIETQWNPVETSTGQSYPDLSMDNLFIITSVSHWKPQFRSGFIQFPYLQFYFARFTDSVLTLEP